MPTSAPAHTKPTPTASLILAAARSIRASAALALLAAVVMAACAQPAPASPETPPTPIAPAPIAAPQTPAPTPAPTATVAPTPSGSGIDSANAAGTLVQLSDPLDEPEYYCVDVPGFGANLNLQAALMAHTCKPGADDEMFALNQPRPGNLYMPAYHLCIEADGTQPPARLYLKACSDSEAQRFVYDPGGALVLSDTDLCMAVSPEDGQPTGGPSHLRRSLAMKPCADNDAALKQWRFPGSSPK